MIETYKILHGHYDQNCVPNLQLAKDSITRGHSLRLYKASVYTSVRAHSFTCRVVNPWNALPEQVVKALSINSFKNRLESHWANISILYDYQAEVEHF